MSMGEAVERRGDVAGRFVDMGRAQLAGADPDNPDNIVIPEKAGFS